MPTLERIIFNQKEQLAIYLRANDYIRSLAVDAREALLAGYQSVAIERLETILNELDTLAK